MKQPPLPLVLCSWADAWVRAEESVTLADVAATHKPAIIHTLGYLLRDDEVGISIANEFYDEDATYRGRTFIPRAMIISVHPHSLTKKRTKKARPTCASPPSSSSSP